MKITLPFPISANRYWRNVNGRMVRSREATIYKQEVGWLCAAAGLEPLAGSVRVTLDFYRPAKRGDLDNLLKVCLDSLNGWAYADDQQIVEIHASRYEGKNNPRVEITIGAIE
jgi:crossover junction endodeoxyribonuclease RusA